MQSAEYTSKVAAVQYHTFFFKHMQVKNRKKL